ncbi:hypothetical protein [Terrimonas pollutisoli]|uniref:hypothetical protein n=1 Tax=Terrimonas pollutisoli TaxID=3034147 RepID=UPI0023EABE89|nr:hypothetical protein [Terrimonas sp. H1YJ31]
MRIVNILTVCIVSLILSHANAQTEAPKGFKKGSIVLADGSPLSGFIKDNIRNSASVMFISGADGKKKNYDGTDLNAAEIEGIKFICIKGDFFKIITEGELNFLQKSSDASGKVTYNGSDAIISGGTEGKPNDYFIYNQQTKTLKLVSKKNLAEVIEASFAGNTAAIDQAKTVNGDLSQLKTAVELYNNRNR